LQPVNAYYRPHKGMKWRPAWELLHKGTGRLTILLGLTNISLGVFLAILPTGWVIAWFTILGVLVASATTMEVMLFFRRRAAAAMAEAAVAEKSGEGVNAVAMVTMDVKGAVLLPTLPPSGTGAAYQSSSAAGRSPGLATAVLEQSQALAADGMASKLVSYPTRM
jgi:hypothetical protein